MPEGARTSLSLAVIAPDLSRSGGAERLALQCVSRWQDRHRITLYSQRFDEALLADLGVGPGVERRQIAEHPWPNPAPHPADRLLQGAFLPRAWSRQIGAHDVYLAHQWPTHRITHRPLVWYAHELHRPSADLLYQRPDLAIENEYRRMLELPAPLPAERYDDLHHAIRDLDLAARPDRVVANSRFTAATLARAFGRDDVDVVYPGVDLPPVGPPRAEEPYFLSVGSLAPHKAHRLAIEATALVEGARLVVVGRGGFGPTLERMIARLAVEDRVTLRSDVDDAGLRELYDGCRAVLFTPVNEPFGMVALEALAAGKPLVATDTGGFREQVDPSCAMVVPPEPAAVAEALAALLDQPEEAERMGQAGRKLAEGHTWDRTASELEAILIEAHRSAAAASTPEPKRRVPEIGVRLRADFGDGFAEGAWRELDDPRAMPRAGFYASHHEDTLRRQLAEIAECGFDFTTLCFGLDDRGLSPQGAATLRHALTLAPELGPAARFALEIRLHDPPRRLLGEALDWLARTLGREPAVVREAGRPLVWLRGAGHDPLPRHAELSLLPAPEPPREGSDAWLLPADDPALTKGTVLKADETREGRAAPARVLVASWNDHPAGDAIEPTVREGRARLEAVRAALARRGTVTGRAG